MTYLQPHERIRVGAEGRHLWGRGYFVAISGNMTDEVILEYIKNQDDIKSDEDFTITDGL